MLFVGCLCGVIVHVSFSPSSSTLVSVNWVVLFCGVMALFMVSVVVSAVGLFLSMKTLGDREKLSPYECGFDTVLSSRSSFSLRFFLLAVLFVVFDVEVVLLLPLVYVLGVCGSLKSLLGTLGFLSFLISGLLHEWREGSLEWVVE